MGGGEREREGERSYKVEFSEEAEMDARRAALSLSSRLSSPRMPPRAVKRTLTELKISRTLRYSPPPPTPRVALEKRLPISGDSITRFRATLVSSLEGDKINRSRNYARRKTKDPSARYINFAISYLRIYVRTLFSRESSENWDKDRRYT